MARRWSNEQLENIKCKHLAGTTVNILCLTYRCSYGAILRAMGLAGIRPHLKNNAGKPRFDAQQIAAILTAYNDGMITSTIAAQYDVSERVIYHTIQKYGKIQLPYQWQRKLDSKEVADVIRLYTVCNLSVRAITKLKGCAKTIIYRALREGDIPLRKQIHRKKPRDFDTVIAEKYTKGISMKSIANELILSESTVSRALSRQGTPIRNASESRRTHKRINHDLFAEVNLNEESEYIAGFITADGYIGKRSEESWAIEFGNKSEDADIIIKIRDLIDPDGNIKIKPSQVRGDYVHQEQTRFTVLSKQMANDLIHLGIGPDKTTRIHPHEKLLNSRHFWRGVVDGDGTVSIAIESGRSSRSIIQLCGSNDICNHFLDYMKTIDPSISVGVHPTGSIYCVRLYGRRAIPIIHSLYHDCRIALNRKSQMAMQIIFDESLNIGARKSTTPHQDARLVSDDSQRKS